MLHPSLTQRPWVLATRHNVDLTHEGVTPLMLAIRASNPNQAKMLLAAGADPLAVCSVAAAAAGEQAGEGWSTPLHAAGE
jgi:ankyrin repeat protein